MSGLNRAVDPPEETIVGYDWQQGELYGYEEGFVIDGQFVPKEDIESYVTEQHTLVNAEDYFSPVH